MQFFTERIYTSYREGKKANQRGKLVLARQVAAGPEAAGNRLFLVAVGRGRDEHHEVREVVVLGAEAVGGPGAEAGTTRDLVPGLHGADRRLVVDRLGVHGSHNAEIVDNFGRAVESMNASSDIDKLRDGISGIHRQLATLLEKNGVEQIEADGAAFDPNLHNAVMRVEDSGVPADTVVEVLQPGYKIGGRVLRPALVKVSG